MSGPVLLGSIHFGPWEVGKKKPGLGGCFPFETRSGELMLGPLGDSGLHQVLDEFVLKKLFEK